MASGQAAWRLVSAIRLRDGHKYWIRRRLAPAPWEAYVERTLEPGLYYPSGDGSADDLLKVLQDDLIAAYATDQPDWQLSIDTATGIVRMFVEETLKQDYEIAWNDPLGGNKLVSNGWPIARGLGLNPAGAPLWPGDESGEATLLSTRPPWGSVYLSTYYAEYLPRRSAVGGWARADHGQIDALRGAWHSEGTLKVGIIDTPFAEAHGEWHAMREFMRYASQGRPFRVYPLASESGAYSDVDTVRGANANTAGYREWILSVDSANWQPEAADDGVLCAFEQELGLLAAVGAA